MLNPTNVTKAITEFATRQEELHSINDIGNVETGIPNQVWSESKTHAGWTRNLSSYSNLQVELLSQKHQWYQNKSPSPATHHGNLDLSLTTETSVTLIKM